MKRRTFLKTASLTLLSLGSNSVRAAVTIKSSTSKPNILFIMTDQQFAEVMSCRMGNQYINTPAMDSLAQNGMLFTKAYTANPLCMPARNSIFTGRYPHETTVQSNDNNYKLNPDNFPCMGTYFKNGGYDTGYVGKWHLSYSEYDKNAHGFDFTKVLYNKGHDDEIPARAIEFINMQRETPFLLTVSFSNPHDMCQLARYETLPSGPIGSPPPVEQRPPLVANHLPPENETDAMTLMRQSYHNSSTFPVGQYTGEQWRRLSWGYCRLVEKVDALIGEVLNGLDQSGQRDNTIIVFTSDHGDCCGAHKFNQKTVFYEESARVPFIISYKGKTPEATTDKLVNTGIDILPTIFDYAGITKPAKLPGRSLRRIAEGEDVSPWREYVVVQNYMIQGGPVDGVVPKVKGRMVRSERYKYCIYSEGEQKESLFDLENDPGEMVNIVSDPAKNNILKQHRNYLKEHVENYADDEDWICSFPLQADLNGDGVVDLADLGVLSKNWMVSNRFYGL